MAQYARETGKKAIIGVRQSESKLRKAKYDTCLQSNGNFSPIYDFSDLLIEDIYRAYDIEVPSCYNYVQRTGCAGGTAGERTDGCPESGRDARGGRKRRADANGTGRR